AERLELAAQGLPSGLLGEDDGMEALDRDDVAGSQVAGTPDLGRATRSGGLEQAVAIEEDGPGHRSIVAEGTSRTARPPRDGRVAVPRRRTAGTSANCALTGRTKGGLMQQGVELGVRRGSNSLREVVPLVSGAAQRLR